MEKCGTEATSRKIRTQKQERHLSHSKLVIDTDDKEIDEETNEKEQGLLNLSLSETKTEGTVIQRDEIIPLYIRYNGKYICINVSNKAYNIIIDKVSAVLRIPTNLLMIVSDGKLSNVATNHSQKKIWDGICTKINSSNTDHQRTVEEIRKKWTTYKSNAKKKVAHNRHETRKTGGGPPPEDISSMDDQVGGIIGDTYIDGIDGGIDLDTETHL
ncbi:unnamed protein product [Mytilus coruscus]|uniref:Myb/SANT-like DNA-binding domain-containing protein n=1 Tax=Mytilus coruscus TaxID=42192 RepID=A0A6J8A863_MYTCO|nr:unnamed protein product [Mytilus coruscus]